MMRQPNLHYTPEEYLALERASATKHEYLDGEILAMAGTSWAHAKIVANIVRQLGNRFAGGPCQAVGSDLRVKISPTGAYTYPDVVAVCGALDLVDDRPEALLNPTVLFEVLSPATESYDRIQKFAHYLRLTSLTDYVLVAQDRWSVERYARQGESWVYTRLTAPDAVLELPALGCALPLPAIYEGVAPPETPPASIDS